MNVSSEGAEALSLLRRLTGDEASVFRSDQLEAILRLVGERVRVLLVQRTGWGKSAVYFIATRMLRDSGSGPTLLVSPLLALMRNQIEAAERLGIRAETINSSNTSEWTGVKERIAADEVDVLLISPERLANPEFRQEVLPAVGRRSGLLVIDEAHCISDWGHDFRPDYRRLVRVLDLLGPGVPVLCCTATANDRVVDDLTTQLGADFSPVRGPLARSGLQLHALDKPSQAERLVWLAASIKELPGTGIIYCLTVADTERVADWLRSRGISAVAYTGDSDGEERQTIEQQLLYNDVKVVVATSALGMGFDKPDLAFVVHYQSTGSPVAYYQQVGRAGRALSQSWGILPAGYRGRRHPKLLHRVGFPLGASRRAGCGSTRAPGRADAQERVACRGERAARPTGPSSEDIGGGRRSGARRQLVVADAFAVDVRPRPARFGDGTSQDRTTADSRVHRHGLLPDAVAERLP